MLERLNHSDNFKMECINQYKYYVIQFTDSPYKDIDNYVCIPSTWIVMRRKMDRKVIVSYPVENPADTAKRVERNQKRSEDWKLYLAVDIYGTDIYEDALIFINGKRDDEYSKYKCMNMRKKDLKLSAPVEKKTQQSKRISKSHHEIDKPLNLVVTSKNNDKSKTKRLTRTTLPTPDIEPVLKRTKIVEPTDSDSDVAKQPSQASERLSEHLPSQTREDFPMQNSCSSKMSVEKSDNRSCVEEIERVENSERERPSNIQNISNPTNSLSNPEPISDTTFFKDLFTVLRSLHTVSANSYVLVDNLSKIILENTEALKDVKKLIAVNRCSNIDTPPTSPSTSTTVEVEKISEKNQSKRQRQQEESDDHGDYSDEGSKKRRFYKRRFVLPPEYDENDSRWTLKHREPLPGLVELMPHTNVYVNSVALSNCKRLSKDCKLLARMLLVEIFTKSALTICSLTGSRARAYDIEGATIRPGLDENARTVLLSYVEEYGRSKNWITVDTQAIQTSLRNKMQEFRLKYG